MFPVDEPIRPAAENVLHQFVAEELQRHEPQQQVGNGEPAAGQQADAAQQAAQAVDGDRPHDD